MHKADIHYYQQEVDVVLHDGDTITVGDTVRLEVLHTPGHTPGGVCYYGYGKLFTEDTLFVGDRGRTDLPYGHQPALGASIRRLMEPPEDTIAISGHDSGPSPTSTLAGRNAIILMQKSMDSMLHSRLRWRTGVISCSMT